MAYWKKMFEKERALRTGVKRRAEQGLLIELVDHERACERLTRLFTGAIEQLAAELLARLPAELGGQIELAVQQVRAATAAQLAGALEVTNHESGNGSGQQSAVSAQPETRAAVAPGPAGRNREPLPAAEPQRLDGGAPVSDTGTGSDDGRDGSSLGREL
jgi:hypothetical protein